MSGSHDLSDATFLALQAEYQQLTADLARLEETAKRVEVVSEAADGAFIWLCSLLVYSMQVGFTLIEAGSIRQNLKSLLLKNVTDLCLTTAAWYSIGYSFAYGPNLDNWIVGLPAPFYMPDDRASWFFSLSFVATGATIVSGAMAERTKFYCYCVFTVLMATFIYPPVCHWVWDESGWMSVRNPEAPFWIIDWAGSGVVHLVGGSAALVGAYMVGPRPGRFDPDSNKGMTDFISEKDRKVQDRLSATQTLWCTMGVFIMIVGWYGFNCGSAGKIVGAGEVVYRVAACTTLSGVCGALGSLCLVWIHKGTIPVDSVLLGSLAGLVSITACCATCSPLQSCIIGCLGSWISYVIDQILLSYEIDDPVKAIPVHAGCGFWGLVAAGLFLDQTHLKEVYSIEVSGWLFLRQVGAATIISAWTMSMSFAAFFVMKLIFGGLADYELERMEMTGHRRRKIKAGPEGNLAFVYMTIASVSSLKSIDASITKTVLEAYVAVARRALVVHQGYESSLLDEELRLVFQDVKNALEFARDVQLGLLDVRWPIEVYMAKTFGLEEDDAGFIIFKGPRVRVGVNVGVCQSIHIKGVPTQYVGATAHKAEDLMYKANGGQILISHDAFEQIFAERIKLRKMVPGEPAVAGGLDEMEENEYHKVGDLDMKFKLLGSYSVDSSSSEEKVYSAVPETLGARKFPDIRENEERDTLSLVTANSQSKGKMTYNVHRTAVSQSAAPQDEMGSMVSSFED